MTKPTRQASAVAVLVLGAMYFAVGVLWRRSDSAQSIVAYDFYGQFYPWALHLQRALHHHGAGLLWNPYQDCGQVFFANIQTALLYPVNLVFALLPREPALLMCVIINLIIAGVGFFGLCRALGMATPAALTAAVAFELGWSANQVASWSPTHLGTFVWIPVAVWQCERLVQQPTHRRGMILGAVLAVQILAGFPQMVVLTVQVIVLRVLWALLRRECPHVDLIRAALVGLALAPLLAAVQLLPAIAVVRDSLWTAPLNVKDLGNSVPSWKGVTWHVAIAGNPLLIVFACVAVVTARRSPHRAAIQFYGGIAVLYFLLSLGPGSWLFDIYTRLPLGSSFRGAGRLLWMTNVGTVVLVGLAADAMLRRTDVDERSNASLAAIAVVTALLVQAISARGFSIADSLLALLLAGALYWLRDRRALAVVLPALTAMNVLIAGQPPVFTLRSGDVYNDHTALFQFVRSRITPQDRVLMVGVHPDLALMPKSATIVALPNIQDYDPMVSRSYAEFFTYLRTGRAYRDMDDWYWLFGKLLTDDLQPALLNLTAARFLLIDNRLPHIPAKLEDQLALVREDGGVRLYENTAALARARYVSRVEIVPDDQVLPALADGRVDVRYAVAAARGPRSGFTAASEYTNGSVSFVSDEPERIALRVHASGPGFLFLADGYAPGWMAHVNGTPQEIVRVDHTFRAVEVPAGDSEVVFTYAPTSVRVGAAVSLVTAALVAATLLLHRHSGERRNPGV